MALSTNRRLNYDIICNEFEKNKIVTSETINGGISIIEFKLGCSAKSKYFYIPPRFRREESLRSLVLFDQELDQHLSFPDIQELNLSIVSKSVTAGSEFTTLPPINYDDKIASLQMKLESLTERKIKFENVSHSSLINRIVMIIIFLIFVIVSAIVVTCLLKRRFSPKYCEVSRNPPMREPLVSPEEQDYLHPTPSPRPPPKLQRIRPKKTVSFNRRNGVVIV